MTISIEQRNEAVQVLQQALTAIREIADFRNRDAAQLSSEARLMVGRLADTVHNIPDWLNGSGYPDDTIARDITLAKQMIAEARSVPSHRHRLIKQDQPRPNRFAFWRR